MSAWSPRRPACTCSCFRRSYGSRLSKADDHAGHRPCHSAHVFERRSTIRTDSDARARSGPTSGSRPDAINRVTRTRQDGSAKWAMRRRGPRCLTR
jgi:hypothetical protein